MVFTCLYKRAIILHVKATTSDRRRHSHRTFIGARLRRSLVVVFLCLFFM